MSDRRRLVHPIDLLVLVLAIGLAVLAYAYLFKRTPVPLVVDPLLNAVITVEFEADREWKQREFARSGEPVMLEEYLRLDVVDGPTPVAGTGHTLRLVLKVAGREQQRPEAMTHFRSGVRRGSQLRLHDGGSEVAVEVVEVKLPAEAE